MSDQEIILERLSHIQRELGTQSEQLTLIDDAIRGPQDQSRPGISQKQADHENRINRLEKGAMGAAGGISATVAAICAYFTRNG